MLFHTIRTVSHRSLSSRSFPVRHVFRQPSWSPYRQFRVTLPRRTDERVNVGHARSLAEGPLRSQRNECESTADVEDMYCQEEESESLTDGRGMLICLSSRLKARVFKATRQYFRLTLVRRKTDSDIVTSFQAYSAPRLPTTQGVQRARTANGAPPPPITTALSYQPSHRCFLHV